MPREGDARAPSNSVRRGEVAPARPPAVANDRPSAALHARSSDRSLPRPIADHHRALIGQTVGGRYRLKGVLGEGGMGTVYDAEHLGLGRQVAIKVLSPTQAKKKVAVKRFQQEARAAGAIGHPNICEVYDMGLLEDGSPYLVMEKLVGQTLADRIAKDGGLPFDEVVDVISQVLSGLIAAHDKGIVHRDIKPENIFLSRRLGSPPIIKILDFGVSKMMPEFQTGEDALDLTRTGMVMGTPYYMSPEQARGERNLDGRVDVYACGVVMYEAIAGKRPFLAPNYNALLLAIINTSPRSIREYRPKTPPELEAMIAKSMAKNRADRYASAKQFLRELTPASMAEPRLPVPPTADERKRSPLLGARVRAPSEAVPALHTRIFETPLRQDGAGAMLRQRIAEAGDVDTRVDLHLDHGSPRRRDTPLPSLGGRAEDSDSVEIPIHVSPLTDDDNDEKTDHTDLSDAFSDEPTEVFRPGKHGPRPATIEPPPASLSSDDWDGETMVTRGPPDVSEFEVTPVPAAPVVPPPSRRRRDNRPFNPDETVNLDRTDDGVEIIDEQHAPPRRR